MTADTSRARSGLAIASLVLLIVSCGGGDPSAPGVPPGPRPRTALDDSLASISARLQALPAGLTDNSARSPIIRELDAILSQEDPATAPNSIEVKDFYRAALARVAAEIAEPVTSGARIWNTYSHGFIVKTASATFAFDLVRSRTPYDSWGITFPDEIINRIDVFFASHQHGDHYDDRLASFFKARGKPVVYPRLAAAQASTTRLVEERDSLTLGGLRVQVYPGVHSAVNVMYEVTTPEGIKVVHTGDTSFPYVLPALADVDILLLNAWISNNTNYNQTTDGLKAALHRLKPRVMLPGHAQELGHNMAGTYSRLTFEMPLQLQDDATNPYRTVVLTWGERLDWVR